MGARYRPQFTATTFRRAVFAGVALTAVPAAAPAATTQGPAIADLLKTGWQIAGYSQAFDNRSTFILFRHTEETYLVQCRVGYDVTRNPSVYTICYELR
ncbi:MAG: hypothetical protein AB7V40_03880 [Methyloceanibacter sp.]